MTDKKALLLEVLAADSVYSPLNIDTAQIQEISENRFRAVRAVETGTERLLAEFHVWTPDEAAEFGYLKGGVDTSDPSYKIYRVI
jgi:hypothetical protein